MLILLRSGKSSCTPFRSDTLLFISSTTATRRTSSRWSSKSRNGIDCHPFHSASTAKNEGRSQCYPVDDDVPHFPIYYNDVYEVDLPPDHRFPMWKYRKVRESVQANVLTNVAQQNVHCGKLLQKCIHILVTAGRYEIICLLQKSSHF